ncbi:hypothetical protein E3P86_00700, partial [Wallemia ichthyophaga]
QLYFRFQSYGRILDVVALKTDKLRGQAWIVFDVLSAATSAIRAENGSRFYSKPMTIHYAKTTSNATKIHRGGAGDMYNDAQKNVQRMTISNASESSLGLKRAREAEELQRRDNDAAATSINTQDSNKRVKVDSS